MYNYVSLSAENPNFNFNFHLDNEFGQEDNVLLPSHYTVR